MVSPETFTLGRVQVASPLSHSPTRNFLAGQRQQTSITSGMDVHGVPRSPCSSIDDENRFDFAAAIEEDQEALQQEEQEEAYDYDEGVWDDGPALKEVQQQEEEEAHEYEESVGDDGPALGEAAFENDDDTDANTWGEFDVPWQHNMRQYRDRQPRSSSTAGDAEGITSPCVPPLLGNETSVLITPTLTKVSPTCANPGSQNANFEHVRQAMLLEEDPAVPNTKKWYDWNNSDGSIEVILGKCMNVLAKMPDERCARAIHLSKASNCASPEGVSVKVHSPFQALLPERDDRGYADASNSFFVNEHRILKNGRYSWCPTDAKYRVSNTKIQLGVEDPECDHQGRRCKILFTFRYENGGKPIVQIENEAFDPTDQMTQLECHAVVAAPTQELAELLDLTQYTERDLTAVRPKDYYPVKTLQLLSLLDSKRLDRDRIAALLTHMGPKIRYDGGKYRVWTASNGWSTDDGDVLVRTAVKAAATDLEEELEKLQRGPLFLSICNRAFSLFGMHEQADEDKEGVLESKAKSFCMVPASDRGLASFIANIQPWLMESGCDKSFEACKDVAFKNCVQEIQPPYATHIETPADRVTTRIDCDLPPSPVTDEEKEALKNFALQPFRDIFIDEDVALREADKMACLLTGTCAVMPEANIRVQIGPYNESEKQFAGGVGKDTIGNHVHALLGDNLSTDWGMAVMSAFDNPEKNNFGFEGIEKSIGHWITDGSATKRDSSELLKWGDMPKKIWAGGAPKHFPLKSKYKDKVAVLPRSNAVYVSAQRFNIGLDLGIWRRLEVSPYPRVAKIKENQSLIDAGIPYFEVDSNYVKGASNMDREARGKHMRYLIDRAIAIDKDPNAAHPPTEKHAVAKELLKRVSGGDANVATTTTAHEAEMELDQFIAAFVHPCEPTGMDAHDDDLDVTEQRKQFQKKGPRCFCRPKKAASEACSFRVLDLAAQFKEKAGSLTYTFFMPRGDHIARLTEAVQRNLGLDVAPVQQVCGVKRGTIFGFTLSEDDESIAMAASSSDVSAEPAPKRVCRAAGEA